MRIALWVVQVLLAAMFVWHGWFFLAPPQDMLALMNGMLGSGLRIFLGVAEILAGIGIILPALTRILPWLTPLAALGMMIVLGSATIFHLIRAEIGSAVTTCILLLFATFVAYMRWKRKPILARTSMHAPA